MEKKKLGIRLPENFTCHAWLRMNNTKDEKSAKMTRRYGYSLRFHVVICSV